ncbi:MAG: hypothetical protein HQ553_03095 [Chloroflexi bacterium]|nr:hypothetical protein [Chloroflexota bacterium]
MKKVILVLVMMLFILAIGGCDDESDGGTSPMEIPLEETITHVEEDVDFFIAVHCEPGGDPLSTNYVALNWLALTDLVNSADDHNMKLTLLMNPQWATYILEDEHRLGLVRDWESNGHEIGLHSHGPHMNSWNGYTNQEQYFNSPDFIGTMDDLMDVVNQLPASEQMVTACIASEDQEYDFPSGIIYETNGGADKLDDLWSTPTEYTWNGQDVLRVTHARYAVSFSEVNIDLQQMNKILDDNESDEIMGIVFHCFEYADDSAPYNALFRLLEENGIHTNTVSAVVEGYE